MMSTSRHIKLKMAWYLCELSIRISQFFIEFENVIDETIALKSQYINLLQLEQLCCDNSPHIKTNIVVVN